MQLLELSSIPLVQIEANAPIGHASGCFVRYKGALFLLSVAHAMKRGRWTIQVRYEPEKQAVLLKGVGEVGFIMQGHAKKGKVRDIDFAYKMLPEPISVMQQAIDEDHIVVAETPKVTLETDLSAVPSAGHSYGFFGLTRQKFSEGVLRTEPRTERGMTYLKSMGEYHVFKTQHQYRSYDDYRGCSGAPILDEHGLLVSLVVEGNKHKTQIVGLNLAKYRAVLDAELLQNQ